MSKLGLSSMYRRPFSPALLFAVAIAMTACGGDELNEAPTADELRISVAELRTFANAEALVCAQFAAGNVPQTFFVHQTAMIRQKLTATRKDLVVSTGEHDAHVQAATEISTQLEKEFAALQSDPAVAASAPESLKSLAAAASALEKQLTD